MRIFINLRTCKKKVKKRRLNTKICHWIYTSVMRKILNCTVAYVKLDYKTFESKLKDQRWLVLWCTQDRTIKCVPQYFTIRLNSLSNSKARNCSSGELNEWNNKGFGTRHSLKDSISHQTAPIVAAQLSLLVTTV